MKSTFFYKTWHYNDLIKQNKWQEAVTKEYNVMTRQYIWEWEVLQQVKFHLNEVVQNKNG